MNIKPDQRRRVEDVIAISSRNDLTGQHAVDLPKVALGWMGDMVREEFNAALPFDGVTPRLDLEREEDAVVWRREWKRRWRRLQLPDFLTAYAEELDRAHTPDAVYAALMQHAVRIVGSYACLLFLRHAESGTIRQVPDSRLTMDSNRLRLRLIPSHAGLLDARTVSLERDSSFAGLAPLFVEEGAVCLAHAPFGNAGTIVMVERRQERVWEAEDWYLLRAVSVQAEAALERVRLYSRVRGLAFTDPVTRLPSGARRDEVLDHAWASVLRGDALSVITVCLTSQGGADDMRAVAEVLRQESRGYGVAVRDGDLGFVLVMPQVGRSAAAEVLERVEGRLKTVVPMRAGMAQYDPSMTSAHALLAAAQHASEAGHGALD